MEISAKILTEAGPLDVGPDQERKIYGVGEFGIDSFNVFCRGDLSVNPGDKTLQSFVNWHRRRGHEKKKK